MEAFAFIFNLMEVLFYLSGDEGRPLLLVGCCHIVCECPTVFVGYCSPFWLRVIFAQK